MKDEHESFEGFEDILKSVFDNLSREYATIINPKRYGDAKNAIILVKKIVDEYVLQFGFEPKYEIHDATNAENEIFASSIVFKVRIPECTGLFVNASVFRDVFDYMGSEDIFSVSSYANGDIDMCFEFKNVGRVLHIK